MSCPSDGKVSGTEEEIVVKEYNMDVNDLVKTTGLRRKASLNVSFCVKKERNASFKKVSRILQKAESDRTEEEKEVLSSCSDVVKEVTSRLEKRKVLKARSEEVEDSCDVLEAKCEMLARALLHARHLVVYSGAGVSTAACIPDYRGTNGIWTRLQQGLDIGHHDLSKTQPTLTHMVLYTLYRRGMLKHVVSQNCDGLHLRSGLPRAALSEVHGNMYLEVCQPCKLEYWRLFDVTEHTARYAHSTARRCYKCHKPLRDTIVHFGERGALKWPINWSGATAAANQADVILCIGSSLKVLKKYPWLWGMDRPVKKRPSLYIINLQWTPKDEQAALKINGKCDQVMEMVMAKLNLPIPEYDPLLDPIFVHATRLFSVETHTYSTAALQPPDEGQEDTKKQVVEKSNDNKQLTEETTGDSKRICDDTNDASATVKAEIKSEEEQSVLLPDSSELDINSKQNDCSTTSKNSENECLKKEDDENLSGNGLLSGNQLKVEVQSESDVDEAKESSKSPVKGIWRPFLFDDNGCSSSSSSGANNLNVESGSLSSKTIIEEINQNQILVPAIHNRPTSHLLQDQNSVKTKCFVQLEPLDLSCTKKKELELPTKENQNPFFCKYCRLHYYSCFCLFYRKQTPDKPPDPACYCCDEDEEKEGNELGSETDTKSVDDSDNKSSAKNTITNPGWFGKGYRKRIRKKR